jgi:hypothetical protein
MVCTMPIWANSGMLYGEWEKMGSDIMGEASRYKCESRDYGLLAAQDSSTIMGHN